VESSKSNYPSLRSSYPRRKVTQAIKAIPHIDEGIGTILVLSAVKLHPQKRRISKEQWGSGGLQAFGLKLDADESWGWY
jgi:hypothetical protein